MKSEQIGVGVFPDVWWIGSTGYVSFLDYATASVVVETWQGDAIQQRQRIASFGTGIENQYARGIGFGGEPYLVYRAGVLGRVRNLTTGKLYETTLPVNGTAPFAFGEGVLAWLDSGGRLVHGVELGTWRDLGVLRDSGEFAKPTGITRVVGRQPIFWDEDRQSQPGMTCPVFTGALTVGENASLTDPKSALGRFADTPGRVLLWPGLDSFEPRAAEGPNGLFAVCSWGNQSVRLAIITRADARVSDPIPGPTPNPPPDPGHPPPPKEPPVSFDRSTIPDFRADVERANAQLFNAITRGADGAFSVTNLAATWMHAKDARFGVLEKLTGNNSRDRSVDIIAYRAPDRIVIIDVIAAAGGDGSDGKPPASLTWAVQGEDEDIFDLSRWKEPYAVAGEPEPGPTPNPPPAPQPSPVDLGPVLAAITALAGTVDALAQEVADTYDRVEALDAQIREIARRLGDVQEQQYQALDGRVPVFGGTVVLTPRRAK